MKSAKRIRPFAVLSDRCGNIYEDTNHYVAGRSGFTYTPLYLDEMIPMPEGSDLFELPGHKTLAYNSRGELKELENGWAVAAFISPAHTQLHSAAYIGTSPVLPLYAYTAVGWYDNQFYVSALRVDQDTRQDARHFNQDEVIIKAEEIRNKYPENRLVEHLIDHCALTYLCPAARNFVMGRWECPIPVSPACNSNCVGCISLQVKDESPIPSNQDRLRFIPTVEEIVEYTLHHLENAPNPVVSFGQGCEGEPLLVWQTIRDAIIEIRKKTKKGIININTNASKPDAVEELMKVGLNSIRVSTNSLQKWLYEAYYRPNNYDFEDIRESARIVTSYGGWASINYFTLPGVTDTREELDALMDFIEKTDLSMIQWRNFNIDIDWYFKRVKIDKLSKPLGVRNVMLRVKNKYPHLAFGYFNPHENIINQYNKFRAMRVKT